MTLGSDGRDTTEIEALMTDRYLDSLLAAHASGADRGPAPAGLDPVLRESADRLSRLLPRLHPSFRFEEALSARLTAAALARRFPAATGAEDPPIALPLDRLAADPRLSAYLDPAPLGDDDPDPVRPLLIGGALTSAALSIAGAAYVAWRRRHPSAAPMVRAVRAVARGRLA